MAEWRVVKEEGIAVREWENGAFGPTFVKDIYYVERRHEHFGWTRPTSAPCFSTLDQARAWLETVPASGSPNP
jgi:hypothetical protein